MNMKHPETYRHIMQSADIQRLLIIYVCIHLQLTCIFDTDRQAATSIDEHESSTVVSSSPSLWGSLSKIRGAPLLWTIFL